VRVHQELLIPAVQHGEESDLGAEQPGVASHLEQGFCAGPEQQIEDGSLVAQRQGAELVRQGEDHMRVGDRQQVAFAGCQPAIPRLGLTLRAMPVAAGVERDDLMFTLRTAIEMRSERRGTTGQDGSNHLHVHPGDPFVAGAEERIGCGADHIGHLEGGPFHLAGAGRIGLVGEQRQPVEWAGDGV